MSPELQIKEDGSEGEQDNSKQENPFGVQTPEYQGELFGTAETDWKDSDALEEVLESNPGFEEDEEFEDLPESGSALLHHDLSNYFQIGLNTAIKDGKSVEEFSSEGLDEEYEEDPERIFQKGEGENSGIGLHISKKIIESFDGEIEVLESHPEIPDDSGMKLAITLPGTARSIIHRSS